MVDKDLSLVISNPGEGKFLQEIGWNKEEFADLVASITEQYNGLAYTEDQMKAAKADRAKLNAMKKAISDRRIEVKKAVMAPYEKFETEVKEVVALIDKPICMIDSQIKEYEEKVKKEKKEDLENFFAEIASEYSDFLTFDMIFSQRYLNASFSFNKAKEDIRSRVERIATDIRSIESFTSDKYRMASLDIYKKTLDVNAALAEDKRLNDLDRKAEEQKRRKEEEEQKRRKEELIRKQEAYEKQCETPMGRAISSIEHQAFSGAVSCENVQNTPENVQNTQENVHNAPENVPETDKSVSVSSGSNSVPECSFPPNEDTKQYKASFTVYGTKAQIMALKQYMIDNNIKFGKVEK